MKRIAFYLTLAIIAGCDGRLTESEPVTLGLDAQLRQTINGWGIMPIGEKPAQNQALVTLGRSLFFDKILSGNRDIACASCHQPGASLSDGLSLAVGTGAHGAGTARMPGPGRQFVSRRSPSLLNSGLGMFYMFWDGRINRFGHDQGIGVTLPILPPGPPGPPGSQNNGNVLIAQAMLTVMNRQEMRGEIGDKDVFGNTNELALIDDKQPNAILQAIMARLTALPEYVQMFNAAFPAKPSSTLTFEDAARAIAAFELDAFTKTNSSFDRYLARDDAAMTVEQKRGALLFFGRAQCSSCHNGPFLGGQQFANVGAPQIGPGGKRQPPLDFGRGELQNNEFYKFAFRVPPLRNVELTSPYTHSGAYKTLEAVVKHYNNVPLAMRNYDITQIAPALRSQFHGDDASINAVMSTLDPRVRAPLNLTETEQRELVAFLKALTDPAARDLRGIAPSRVPSGLAVDM